MSWQTVLGFEIHIELATVSKMFCGCPAGHFGKLPNSQVCPVCLGLPGALPVPNKKAIEWTVKLGLALGCKINLLSKFDRKHYFYPDLPKGYQISQYDLPFCYDGQLLGHKITRVHLEEDTGKLQHQGDETLIDFNRSSVPLVEVVTEPDFSDLDEAIEFLKELQMIVRALEISSADMEKGSMRLEANISVRSTNSDKLPDYKIEIKNINSFKFVKRAVEFDVARQIKILESGQTPVQETRGFSESKGETVSQRSKENAQDYRYFPDPDIPPIQLTEAQVSEWKKSLPKLPNQIRSELLQYGLSDAYVKIIAGDKTMHAEFLKSPSKATADALVNKRPTKTVSTVSSDAIRTVAQKVIAANPKAVSDIKSGKPQVIFFIIGQIKKELGDVDVQLTQKVINEIIGI